MKRPVSKPKFKCPYCHLDFYSRMYRQAHIQEEHINFVNKVLQRYETDKD